MHIIPKKLSFLLVVTFLLPYTLTAASLEMWVPPLPILPVKSFIVIDAVTHQVLAAKNIELSLPVGSLIDLPTIFDLARRYPETTTPVHDTMLTKTLQQLQTAPNAQKHKNIIKSIYHNHTTYQHALYDVINHTGLKHTTVQIEDAYPILTSTAQDIAILTATMLHTYPKLTPYLNSPEATANPSIVSLKKTLATEKIQALALRASHEDKDIIIVILGAQNAALCLQASDILLQYAFKFYKKINISNTVVVPQNAFIAGGKKHSIALQKIPLYPISVPVSLTQWKTRIHLLNPLKAPIQENSVIGSLDVLSSREHIIYSYPLRAAETVQQASNLYTYIQHAYIYLTHRTREA